MWSLLLFRTKDVELSKALFQAIPALDSTGHVLIFPLKRKCYYWIQSELGMFYLASVSLRFLCHRSSTHPTCPSLTAEIIWSITNMCWKSWIMKLEQLNIKTNELILPRKLDKHSVHFSACRQSKSKSDILASFHVASSKKLLTSFHNESSKRQTLWMRWLHGGICEGILLVWMSSWKRWIVPKKVSSECAGAYQADRAIGPGNLLHALVCLNGIVR